MLVTVRRPERLAGELRVPGDKSISHRALILNAVASGQAAIRNLSPGGDVDSTARCLRALGVEVSRTAINGVGLHGLRAPKAPLDCGNSGTTMRLLAGLLAGQPFPSVLVGDDSLSRRPMDRVVHPLREMGAKAEVRPLRVGGGGNLMGIQYQPAVPSAQVKSALLLAGLYAEGTTRIIEPVPTRNHTELMLQAMGADCRIEQHAVAISRTERLAPLDVDVPGDLSAAVFWVVAAGLHPRAGIRLPAVGVNPTRGAVLDHLLACGFDISVQRCRRRGAEETADLAVGSSAERPRARDITGTLSAALIDELPALAVAATQMEGTTLIAGAVELRVKESDRVAAMASGLAALGADVEEQPDGLRITGPRALTGARVSAAGDHRVALALAVAGMLARGHTEIDGAECVDISYPGFWDELAVLGALC